MLCLHYYYGHIIVENVKHIICAECVCISINEIYLKFKALEHFIVLIHQTIHREQHLACVYDTYYPIFKWVLDRKSNVILEFKEPHFWSRNFLLGYISFWHYNNKEDRKRIKLKCNLKKWSEFIFELNKATYLLIIFWHMLVSPLGIWIMPFIVHNSKRKSIRYNEL